MHFKNKTQKYAIIYNKFKNTMSQKGLREMESKGTAFDPDLHDAITNIPAPSEDLKGKVVDEIEKWLAAHHQTK